VTLQWLTFREAVHQSGWWWWWCSRWNNVEWCQQLCEDDQLIVARHRVGDVARRNAPTVRRVNSTTSDVARDVSTQSDTAMTSAARVNQALNVVCNLWINGVTQLASRVGPAAGLTVCGPRWLSVRRSARHCGRRALWPLNWEVMSTPLKTRGHSFSYCILSHEMMVALSIAPIRRSVNQSCRCTFKIFINLMK